MISFQKHMLLGIFFFTYNASAAQSEEVVKVNNERSSFEVDCPDITAHYFNEESCKSGRQLPSDHPYLDPCECLKKALQSDNIPALDRSIQSWACVQKALPFARSKQAAKRLLEAKANPNEGRMGEHCLFKPSKDLRPASLLDFLCKYVNVNQQNYHGETPLFQVCEWGITDIARKDTTFDAVMGKICTLLHNGARRHVENKKGKIATSILLQSNLTEAVLLAKAIETWSPQEIAECAQRAIAEDEKEEEGRENSKNIDA